MNFWQRLSIGQKILSLLLLHSGLLLIFVFFRYIDADEGLYLSAAREVFWGHRPYLDFMYVQTPYYPYFLAPLSHFGWSGLFFCRLISALAPLFTGALIFSLARRLWNEKTAFVLWGFWILNGLVLVWGSVAKPAGWGDFLLFLGFWALFFGANKFAAFFSGLSSGMAVNLRGFLLFPAAVWPFSLVADKTRKAKDILFWLCGFLVALTFCFYFLFQSRGAFFFNNYTYHRLWGTEVLSERFTFFHRVAALMKFLFFPQNLVLYLLAAVGIVLRPTDFRKWHLMLVAGTAAIILHIAFFASIPSMVQYYVETLPYLALLAGFGLAGLREKTSSNFWRLGKWGLISAHVISLGLVVYIFLLGQRPRDQQYLLSNVRPVVTYLVRNGTPSDTIFSEWPGYAVLAGMRLPRGTETVGLDVAHLLSQKEKKAYHILDSARVDSILANKGVKWVVTGGTVTEVWPKPLGAGYKPAFKSGPIAVYRRNE